MPIELSAMFTAGACWGFCSWESTPDSFIFAWSGASAACMRGDGLFGTPGIGGGTLGEEGTKTPIDQNSSAMPAEAPRATDTITDARAIHSGIRPARSAMLAR